MTLKALTQEEMDGWTDTEGLRLKGHFLPPYSCNVWLDKAAWTLTEAVYLVSGIPPLPSPMPSGAVFAKFPLYDPFKEEPPPLKDGDAVIWLTPELRDKAEVTTWAKRLNALGRRLGHDVPLAVPVGDIAGCKCFLDFREVHDAALRAAIMGELPAKEANGKYYVAPKDFIVWFLTPDTDWRFGKKQTIRYPIVIDTLRTALEQRGWIGPDGAAPKPVDGKKARTAACRKGKTPKDEQRHAAIVKAYEATDKGPGAVGIVARKCRVTTQCVRDNLRKAGLWKSKRL